MNRPSLRSAPPIASNGPLPLTRPRVATGSDDAGYFLTFTKRSKQMKQIHLLRLLQAAMPLLLGIAVHAQDAGEETSYHRGATRLENILPPAPEAASAVKYADVPFTHSLGLAEYSVPVWVLKGRELAIPISLDYRSGGVRVDDIGGVVGLGWSLNAGGCVTREVTFMPDEFSGQFQACETFYKMPTAEELSSLQSNPHPQQGVGLNFLNQVLHNQRDCSPDRFSYTVCGLSGTFIMTPSGAVEQITGEGVQISYDSSGEVFTIIGPDGTVYSLGGSDAVEWGKRKNQIIDNATPYTNQHIDWEAITAWHLKTVTSRDGLETATFTYSDGGTWNKDATSRSASLTASSPTVNGAYTDINIGTPRGSNVQSEHRVKVLSGISLGYYTASFTYAQVSSRVLYTLPDGETAAYNYPRRLTRISVGIIGTSASLLKLDLDTGEAADDGRILLNGLQLYRGGVLDDRWDFSYKTAAHSGCYALRISRLSQDWYGYYNAELDGRPDLVGPEIGGGLILPENPDPGSGSSGGSQSGSQSRTWLCPYTFQNNSGISMTLSHGLPNADAASYLMLEKADHDGAVTEWEYEGNTVAVPHNSLYYDGEYKDSVSVGVRVKRIKVKDKTNLVRVRSFTYADPVANVDIVPSLDKYADISGQQFEVTVQDPGGSSHVAGVSYSWSMTVSESPVDDGMTLQSASITYGTVTEDACGASVSGGIARTVYHYDTSDIVCPSYDNWSMFPADWAGIYNTVTGYGGINPKDGVRKGYRAERSGGSALLLSKETYAQESNGSFSLVQEEKTSYMPGVDSEVLTGYRVQQVMDRANGYGNENGKDYIHYPVYVRRQVTRMPFGQTVIRHHEVPEIHGHGMTATNDTVAVSIQYAPRTDLSIPERVRRKLIHSSAGPRSVTYTYPDEISGAGYSALTSAHALSSPVKSEWRNDSGSGVPDTELSVEYSMFSGIWMPSSIVEKTLGTESHRVTIHSRDVYGNIADYKETGSARTVVLWSYVGIHPVAVIENASLQDVVSAVGGQNMINLLTRAPYPGSLQMPMLTGLRSSLPDSHVTRMMWTRGKGMSSMIAPSGVSRSYEYDGAGHLIFAIDAEGYATDGWEYNLYDGPSGDGRRSIRHTVYRSPMQMTGSTDVTWYNTLGMRLQDIELGAGPGGADLVYHRDGDFMLHDDVKLWLPYPENTLGGAYQPSAAMESVIENNSSLPYTFTGYEKSSRDKVLETALPGYYNSSHKTVCYENTLADLDIVEWQGDGIAVTGSWSRCDLHASWTTDADGRIVSAVVDPKGRTLLTGRRSPLDMTINPDQPFSWVRYVYDSHDRLRAVVSPGISYTDTLNMWRYSYDARGRVKSKGIPGSVREHYVYDDEDRLVSVRKGDVLKEMEYDDFGRIVKVWVSEGAAPTRTLVEQHWYDEYPGEALSIINMQSSAPSESLYDRHVQGSETMVMNAEIDGDGAVGDPVFTVTVYDIKGRPVNTVTRWTPTTYSSVTTEYCFDGQPSRIVSRSVESDGAHDLTTDYSYDIRGRLVREITFLRDDEGEVSRDTTSYTYDRQGRLSGRSSLSGSRAVGMTDTFTLQGWLSSRTWTKDGSFLYKETLRYDAPTTSGTQSLYTGMISEKNEQFSGPGAGTIFPQYITEGYRYDYAGRLVKTGRCYAQTGAGASLNVEDYAYDARGNIITSSTYTGSASPTDSRTHQYSGDRLASVTSGGYQPGGVYVETVWEFTHDNLGRMTHDGRSGYDISYNYLDLPRKITGNGTTLGKYSYLSDGTLTGTIRTDGTGFVRRGLLTYRKNSDGSLTFEGADFSAGRMTCGEVIYDITDHLGSIKSVVRSGFSTPLVYNIYDAFGKESSTRLCSPSGAEPSLRWGFTGKENQSTEFGISYVDFGARQYSPALCRWMVPDPLSEKYYGISPYAYCANNPVCFLDINGENYDDYYSSLTGKYLGSDASGTSSRLIDEDTFVAVSNGLMFVKNGYAMLELRTNSRVISIDEATINSDVQEAVELSNLTEVEHQVYIGLNRKDATVSSFVGPSGTNNKCEIITFPAPVTGINFIDKLGGIVLIGQVHGHPESTEPNHITQSGMSEFDMNSSKNLQIPIWGIDAMSINKMGNDIHIAYPNGTTKSFVGKTRGTGFHGGYPFGLNSLKIWGLSSRPSF